MVSIELKAGASATNVLAKLSAPAILADAPMKTSDGALTLAFDIKNGHIKRFLETLKSRGLVSSSLRLSFALELF